MSVMETNATRQNEAPWIDFFGTPPALPAKPSPGTPGPARTWDHRITYPTPRLLTSIKEMFWFWGVHGPWSRLRKSTPGLHAPLRPQANLRKARPGEVRITWAGHASFIVQMGGRTLLLDPIWSNTLPGGIRRLVEPGIPWEGLPAIDGVLISHNHFDHMDKRTLLRLPKDTPMFVPHGNAGWFERHGFLDVTELDWWQDAGLGGLRIELVPAHHWSRRGLFDRNHSLWGGWVITDANGRKVYFSGDTAYGTCFEAIGKRHPNIDVALLPVGAYAPREHNGGVHTDPEEAVQAFRDLGAKAMVPMHWGTFRLSPEPVMEPIEWTRRAWADAGLDANALWEMPVGGSRSIAAPARNHSEHQHQPIRLPVAQTTQVRVPFSVAWGASTTG
ncbi:MAG: MBL fold metallo-hydrolase [Candidatus Thermoplasmatota archaeon]